LVLALVKPVINRMKFYKRSQFERKLPKDQEKKQSLMNSFNLTKKGVYSERI